ncbi:MAG TPA: anti-sigma factor antagonist [Solibacterales bacterium]|nr:anti-sigma factor antagonist [Bryobacterales bacterium]
MTVTRRQVGDVVVLDLVGDLTLGSATGRLRDGVIDALQTSSKVVLNLAGLGYMDSSGLGEMVGAYTTVSGRGGTLKLLNPQKKLTDLLGLTRLYTLFEIYDDEAAATASFGQAAGA